MSPCSLQLSGLAVAAIQRPAAAGTKRAAIWATSWFGSLDCPTLTGSSAYPYCSWIPAPNAWPQGFNPGLKSQVFIILCPHHVNPLVSSPGKSVWMEVLMGKSVINGTFSSTPYLITGGYLFGILLGGTLPDILGENGWYQKNDLYNGDLIIWGYWLKRSLWKTKSTCSSSISRYDVYIYIYIWNIITHRHQTLPEPCHCYNDVYTSYKGALSFVHDTMVQGFEDRWHRCFYDYRMLQVYV